MNKLQEAIERDGLEHATKRIAEIISFQDDYLLNDKKKAYQFILEEIEAASLGNEEAIRFALDSGIPSSEYTGAMKRSRPEIDGKTGPQQFLSIITMQLSSDKDLMVKFRTKVVDKVMKHFYFGKYASNESTEVDESTGSTQEDFNQAKAYLKNGTHGEAAKWFRKAAEQGHAVAQYNLGAMYYEGEGVVQSDNEAVKWFREAAEQGLAEAQQDLGNLYYTGKVVVQSNNEAVKWYRKAAEQGFIDAQFCLGSMYYEGKGVVQSNNDAAKWFRKAAEQGDVDAQNKLNVIQKEKYASNESTGIKKYTQLKQLMQNKEISKALMFSASGINLASPIIANEVNTAVGLVNYLSTLTGASGVELISAIIENKNDKKITSVILDKESLEENESVGSDDSWMDVLLQWANENNLVELQDLDTFAFKQTGFPKNKNQFSSMEYLHLTNSNISYLPPELGKLKNLRAICLDGNSIDNYPKEMCTYKNLIRLDLDDNNISNFPREIGNLTSLQKISFKNNSIIDFPIEMTKLVNLRSIDIRGQAISLTSKDSPLSEEGWKVYLHFSEQDIVKR